MSNYTLKSKDKFYKDRWNLYYNARLDMIKRSSELLNGLFPLLTEIDNTTLTDMYNHFSVGPQYTGYISIFEILYRLIKSMTMKNIPKEEYSQYKIKVIYANIYDTEDNSEVTRVRFYPYKGNTNEYDDTYLKDFHDYCFYDKDDLPDEYYEYNGNTYTVIIYLKYYDMDIKALKNYVRKIAESYEYLHYYMMNPIKSSEMDVFELGEMVHEEDKKIGERQKKSINKKLVKLINHFLDVVRYEVSDEEARHMHKALKCKTLKDSFLSEYMYMVCKIKASIANTYDYRIGNDLSDYGEYHYNTDCIAGKSIKPIIILTEYDDPYDCIIFYFIWADADTKLSNMTRKKLIDKMFENRNKGNYSYYIKYRVILDSVSYFIYKLNINGDFLRVYKKLDFSKQIQALQMLV